ncbi:M48 family metallopeptidase [Parenemella sanctibonifatiensis]|uniref:Peptidase M48 n=1 Tax=Parenemella sanctibonifatiensis TaxID=2016505 RepID=A0A255E6W9_9ACTN|nr:M48 family metallopeptidase [Parenemella sanctibonifatiensis]OYN85245.1 peptidase M48 [Parenemella sanctibonifatiensis]
MAKSRTRLTGISSRAWEHPADRGALVALRKLRGFDRVVKALSGLINERMIRMDLLGSSVSVSERQFPRVHRAYIDAAYALDVPTLPELFVLSSPQLNAFCIGIDTPKIVVTSGLMEIASDEELRALLGHELGHALSGHALYRTLSVSLLQLSQLVSGIPIGYWGLRMIVAGLQEWSRKSELSSDRAGLLAGQDVQASISILMKLASGGNSDQMDQAEFMAQAREVHSNDDVRDIVARVLLVETASHPMLVDRAGELQSWVDSGAYKQILSGSYPTRDGDADATMTAEATAAAQEYQEKFKQGQATLVKLAKDLTDGVADVGQRLSDRLFGGTQT